MTDRVQAAIERVLVAWFNEQRDMNELHEELNDAYKAWAPAAWKANVHVVAREEYLADAKEFMRIVAALKKQKAEDRMPPRLRRNLTKRA